MVAECLEGQGRFVDKLIDGIWAILEETSWVIPAHNTSLDGAKYQLPDAYRGEIRYVDLFSAETGSLLAWVYHFLKDVLEEAVPHVIVDRMQYELNRRILEPYLQYDMPWMGLDLSLIHIWISRSACGLAFSPSWSLALNWISSVTSVVERGAPHASKAAGLSCARAV